MNHLPDLELFSAYLDGELTAQQQAQIERLLAADPEARQLLEDLRTVRQKLQALPTYKLSEDLASKVLQEVDRRRSAPSSAPISLATSDLPASVEPASPSVVSPLAGPPTPPDVLLPELRGLATETTKDGQKAACQEIKPHLLPRPGEHVPSETLPNARSGSSAQAAWNTVFRRFLSSRGLLWSSVAVAVAMGLWIFGPQGPHPRPREVAQGVQKPAVSKQTAAAEGAISEENGLASSLPAEERGNGPKSVRRATATDSAIRARSTGEFPAASKEFEKGLWTPAAPPPPGIPTERASRPTSPKKETMPEGFDKTENNFSGRSGPFADRGAESKPKSAPELSPTSEATVKDREAANALQMGTAGGIPEQSHKPGYGAGSGPPQQKLLQAPQDAQQFGGDRRAGAGEDHREAEIAAAPFPGGMGRTPPRMGFSRPEGSPIPSEGASGASPLPPMGAAAQPPLYRQGKEAISPSPSAEQLVQKSASPPEADRELRKSDLPKPASAAPSGEEVPGAHSRKLATQGAGAALAQSLYGAASRRRQQIPPALPDATLVVVCDLSSQAIREKAFEQILTKQQILLEELETVLEEVSEGAHREQPVSEHATLVESPPETKQKQNQAGPHALPEAWDRNRKTSSPEPKRGKSEQFRTEASVVAETPRSEAGKHQAEPSFSPSSSDAATESQLHFVFVEATAEQVEGALKAMQTRPQEFLSVVISPAPADPAQQLYRQYTREYRGQNALPGAPPALRKSESQEQAKPHPPASSPEGASPPAHSAREGDGLDAAPAPREQPRRLDEKKGLPEKSGLDKASSQGSQQPSSTSGNLAEQTQQNLRGQQSRARRLRLPEELVQQMALPPQPMPLRNREQDQLSKAPSHDEKAEAAQEASAQEHPLLHFWGSQQAPGMLRVLFVLRPAGTTP